jgi:hypothetical protein
LAAHLLNTNVIRIKMVRSESSFHESTFIIQYSTTQIKVNHIININFLSCVWVSERKNLDVPAMLSGVQLVAREG